MAGPRARPLKIGPKLILPGLEAQTQTIVVYGGKGMGKTNLGSVFVEELARHRLRFAWIDPVGVAWGLKHSADGKGEGIPVLILGGRHGDLPIEPTAGAVVADLVVDEEVSVIIDISRKASGEMWSQGEKIRFVRDYCLRLFQRQGERRRPLMQVIDEAGRFVPQQMPKSAVHIAECVGAIEQLVELGRNVGVGVLLITQRSARMAKSVSELAEMMVAFRTVGPRSTDAIIDWFGEHVPKKQWGPYVERLRQLDVGTALVVSPGWLGVEGEYSMRPRETFDSSDTPVAGAERKPIGKGAAIDHEKYLARMADTIEQAKAEDPKELRNRIRELERELTKRPTEKETVEVEKVVEVPVLTNGTLKELREAGAALATAQGRMEGVTDNLFKQLGRIEDAQQARVADTRAGRTQDVAQHRARGERPSGTRTPRRESTPRAAAPPAPEPVDGEVKLGKAPAKMLEVLAQRHPMRLTKSQLCTLAGYRPPKRSSTTRNAFSALRTSGYIEEAGEEIWLSDAGVDAAGDVPPPPSPEEALEHWRSVIGQAPRAFLDVLVEAWPELLTREEACERAGYEPPGQSSTSRNALSTLRRNGLMEDVPDGLVKASDDLVEGARR